MKFPQRFLLLTSFFLLSICSAEAQGNPAAKNATDTLPRPIKLSVKFAALDTLVSTAVMKQVLDANLVVKDNYGNSWKIIKFSFFWHRKELTQDYNTGQPKTLWSYYGSDVDSSSKIPANYQTEMKGNIQSTEQIVFDKILVENPATKKLRQAPSLVIVLK